MVQMQRHERYYDITLDDGTVQLWEGYEVTLEATFDTPFSHDNWIKRNESVAKQVREIIYQDHTPRTADELTEQLYTFKDNFERPYRYGTEHEKRPNHYTRSRNGFRELHYIL